jgi:hypothetical protein
LESHCNAASEATEAFEASEASETSEASEASEASEVPVIFDVAAYNFAEPWRVHLCHVAAARMLGAPYHTEMQADMAQ